MNVTSFFYAHGKKLETQLTNVPAVEIPCYSKELNKVIPALSWYLQVSVHNAADHMVSFAESCCCDTA